MLHKKRTLSICIMLMMIFFITSDTIAADNKTIDERFFSQIPILHEGRIKPMESFARAELKSLSESEAQATPWLIEAIFDPATAETKHVIKIRNPDVLNLLELEKRSGMLFSYLEISQAMNKKQEILSSIMKTEEEQWTPAQRDLIMLQNKLVSFSDLMSSLTLFAPLSVELPAQVDEKLKPYVGKILNYVDTLKFQETLQTTLQAIIKNKGEKIEKYSDSEKAIALLSFSTASLREFGQKSAVFRVITRPQKQWVAPWQIITDGAGDPQTAELFEDWKTLVKAYHEGDIQAWYALSEKIYNETLEKGGTDLRKNALFAEQVYTRIQPFFLSVLFYTLSLSILIFALITKRSIFNRGAFYFLICGGMLHLSGVLLRIYILERPPVSTLYESILCVGLIAVWYGILSYAYKRDLFNLYLSAGAGILFYVLGVSHNQDGDSLRMLSAVLNTNFWLATHVICITCGYAFCLITSILSHFALIKMVAERKKKHDANLYNSIRTMALFSLLFAATGTVLGGIWADQSWGRFWGWDPKENGALLIVLWLIWVLHGRVSGQMKPLAVVFGLAYLSVIVALSWFGVNLLSVGLHAYGFTDTAAWNLGVFVGAETIIMLGIAGLIIRNARHHEH